MDATTQLLQHNAAYAESFDQEALGAPPTLKVAVVTCMDCRIDPARALGLDAGEAHVIRNAGGVVTEDVIRSLSISQHRLGTEEIMVLHHTHCGMLAFADEEFAAALERETGERPGWQAGGFRDLDGDVRDSVRRVLASPFIPHKRVRGFVFDVHTGRIREVS
jgi:carbonic anhydrase